MKSKIIFVVGLLTNLRWDCLKLFFPLILWGGGGKVKSDCHDKEGGEGG